MTKRVAENGASLETIKRITDTFHTICNTSAEKQSTLDTELTQDVEHFSNTLKSALIKHLQGSDDAVETFKDALKQRSALLSSRAIKNQGQGELSVYLKNIVHLADDGDAETSLKMTKDLHANALDENYQGIEPRKTDTQDVKLKEPIL